MAVWRCAVVYWCEVVEVVIVVWNDVVDGVCPWGAAEVADAPVFFHDDEASGGPVWG